MAAADGAFDAPTEAVRATLASPVAGARHLAFVRGRDAAGNWGPVSAAGLAPSAALLPFIGR